jgi:DNA-binding SARP family transcriptional activator
MLALNANRVITVDQLVDAVWGVHPPSTPRTQIQICVSGLRKTLRTIGCTARITTLDPGYVLEIDGDKLDRHVFDRLVRSAQTHEAADRLDEAVGSLRSALALWRGPALTDVPGEVIGAAARRLDERRVTADSERLRLELAMGRHAEIIPDLRALVDENPMREELYANLMLALYRAGRQTEALEAFREARAVLVEEVGIEPTERLRSLERAILNREKGLDAPQHVPPPQVTAGEVGGQLPAGIADFTSRETLLAEIRSLLSTGHGDPAGFLPIVGLSGRGGIGKSCLAVQAAHMLGESFPDGQLYANLRGSRHDQAGDVLARFLRALGVPAAAIPDSLREREELYRSKLTGRRILVVLDNVEDEYQVPPLLPGVPRCGVIVTSRSGLSALSGARWIHLTGLDREQSLALLTRQLGEDRVAGEREAAVDLVRLCAGLPLALRIAAARLIARPHLRIADFVALLADEDRRLDELSHGCLELRSTINSSYEALPEDARRLLRRLSVIESAEFPGWAAAALLDTGVRPAWALIESLVDAGMLDAVAHSASGSVRYGFPDFVRAFAREQLEARESSAARAEATRRWLGGLLSRVRQAHDIEHGDGYPVQPSPALRWAPRAGRTWAAAGRPRPTSSAGCSTPRCAARPTSASTTCAGQ